MSPVVWTWCWLQGRPASVGVQGVGGSGAPAPRARRRCGETGLQDITATAEATASPWGERGAETRCPSAGQRQENLGNHGHRLGYSCDHLCGRVWPLPKGSPSCWRSELSAGAWRITLSLRVCTARGHHPSVRAVHTKENTDSHVRRRVLTADPKELLLQRCPWWSGS